MAARREYSPEVKAAVLSALLTGQSAAQIADEYHIPETTIRSWKSRQRNGEAVAEVATEKREQIGELLVEYLATSLATLRAQMKVFSDERWLKLQSASEVAVLHGVLADKAIRLLEALADDTEDTV